jgi:hypothetical protein
VLKIIFPLLAVFFLVPQALAISPTDTEEILVVIEAYYDGMTRGDADVLDKVSHEDWHMKTLAGPIDDPLLVAGKKEFIEFNRGKKQPEYANDRHITSIDVANNSLAVVRIDKPSKRHSVFFTLVKIKGAWLMINKTFIAASEAKKYSLP